MLIAAVFLLIFSGFDVYGNKEKAADMDNSGIRPKDQRLLLNDPSTLLKEIEALKIEMTSLKSHMATQDTEVTTLNTKIKTLNTEMNSKNTELNSVNTELNSVNTELNSVNADVTKLKAEVLTQRTLIQSLQSRKGKYIKPYNSYNSAATVYSLFATNQRGKLIIFIYQMNLSTREKDRRSKKERESIISIISIISWFPIVCNFSYFEPAWQKDCKRPTR